MPRLPPISPPPSTTTLLRTPRILSSRLADRHRLYSRQTTPTTGPNASTPPSKADDNAFNKTGERRGGEEEANRISMVHDEYSKSGGDDAVVEQVKAAFKNATDTDPLSEKATAGRGNVINPLEVSPATPEVSATVEETYVHQNATRAPDAKTGPGITTTRKSKKVEKVEIDFSKMKMRGR